MKNLLITLYSVLDSGFWNIEQVRTWADKVIVNNDNPECWIVDLCLARTPEDALTIIVNAVADSRITFPEKMGELLIGFIILRHEKLEISNDEMKRAIIEILDSYDKLDLYDDEEYKSLLGFGGYEYNDYKSKSSNAIFSLNDFINTQ